MSSHHTFKIKLSQLAEKDIIEILSFTEKMWGARQADDYENLLHEGLSYIADNPYIGRTKPDLQVGIFCFNAGKHIIFYRMDDRIIHILRILHDSMDYVRHI